jgi:hypothetical protein
MKSENETIGNTYMNMLREKQNKIYKMEHQKFKMWEGIRI